ncbi:MAG: hypothetical protein RL220_940 [Bacteroidota bacterium]
MRFRSEANKKNRLWEALPAAGISVLFTCVVAYLSLTNHNLFRTYALDLGVFNHALYQISHFHQPVFSLGLDGKVVPFLSDHFSPLVYVLAWPFPWFGSSWLLWVQILLVPIFCFYAWRLAVREGISPLLSWMVPALGMVGWMVYAAFGFDFHMNVLAAMLVIPMWYCFKFKRWFLGLIFWLVILLSKENMALWLTFITSALLIFEKTSFSKRQTRWLYVLSILSLIYFVVVVMMVMPALHPDSRNVQLAKYVGSEGGLMGVAKYCLQDPVRAFKLFVMTEEGRLSEDKLAFLEMILLSGGLLFFFSPRVLWMAMPLLAQKVLSVNPGFWGIEAQYSIEFMPLIVLASIDAFRTHKLAIQFVGLSTGMLVSAFACISVYMPESNRADIFSSSFTRSAMDIEALEAELANVPGGLSLCTNACLGPRLCERDLIYHFPFTDAADALVLMKKDYSTYPLNSDEYKNFLDGMQNSSEWSKVFDGKEILIYQRKGITP